MFLTSMLSQPTPGIAVVGTGTSGSVRGAPQPNRDIFVFRVELGDADGIKNYMTVRNIEKKSNDEAHLKSFKVTVCVAQLVHVLEPDFWPKVFKYGVMCHSYSRSEVEYELLSQP